jgi:hypothetical protein
MARPIFASSFLTIMQIESVFLLPTQGKASFKVPKGMKGI